MRFRGRRWRGQRQVSFPTIATPPTVPLPAAGLLLIGGLGGLGLMGRKRTA